MSLKTIKTKEEYQKILTVVVVREEGKRPVIIIREGSKIIDNGGLTLFGLCVEMFPEIDFMKETNFEEEK